MPTPSRYSAAKARRTEPMPLCECGCGKRVRSLTNGLPSRFLVRHDRMAAGQRATIVLLDIDAYWRAIARRAAQ